jgi:hypothetical protein
MGLPFPAPQKREVGPFEAVTKLATTPRRLRRFSDEAPTFGYLSDLGECLGDHALTEIQVDPRIDEH